MIIYLIRHGADDENFRGGWSERCLTSEGKKQASVLSERIFSDRVNMNIGKIFSSDLKRAVETAESIASVLNLKIETMPVFRECNNGKLAGMKNSDAEKIYPGLYWSTLLWDEPYPDGESPKMFYQRIVSGWKQFTDIVRNDDKNCILVTHGGVIGIILSLINKTEWTNKAKSQTVKCCDIIPVEIEE